MRFAYHKRNEHADLRDLINRSIDEVVAMERRQNAHDSMVLDRRIPAEATDSDILIMDTLHRCQEYIDKAQADEASYSEKVELVADNKQLGARLEKAQGTIAALKTDVSFLMSVARSGERLTDEDVKNLRENLAK